MLCGRFGGPAHSEASSVIVPNLQFRTHTQGECFPQDCPSKVVAWTHTEWSDCGVTTEPTPASAPSAHCGETQDAKGRDGPGLLVPARELLAFLPAATYLRATPGGGDANECPCGQPPISLPPGLWPVSSAAGKFLVTSVSPRARHSPLS